MLDQKAAGARARVGLARAALGEAARGEPLFAQGRLRKAFVEHGERREREHWLAGADRALDPSQQRELLLEAGARGGLLLEARAFGKLGRARRADERDLKRQGLPGVSTPGLGEVAFTFSSH